MLSRSMFSSRIAWDLPQNQLTSALGEKRRAGARVLDLTESNPTRVGLLEKVLAADLLHPLSDPQGLRYEPNPRGAPEARQAVARYYEGRGLLVDPEHLVLCASTSEAYSWLFQLLCDVDDRVLYPQPSYPLLEHLSGLCSVRLSPYPLDYDGRWTIDLSALRAACQPETRAVILVNPNNPTGSFLHRDELQVLAELCQKHQMALIADEVFGDYVFAEAEQDAAQYVDRVTTLLSPAGSPQIGALHFVLSGLSKVLGLPQLKLGWIHVGGPEPLRSAAQERLELIADTFLSVGTPVQRAAPELLRHQRKLGGAIARRVQDNRQLLAGLFAGTACQLLRAEGGWYAVVRLPRILSEEEWVLLLLREDDVLCYPGYFFDFPEEAYLVLSLLPEPSVMELAARRIVQRVHNS